MSAPLNEFEVTGGKILEELGIPYRSGRLDPEKSYSRPPPFYDEISENDKGKVFFIFSAQDSKIFFPLDEPMYTQYSEDIYFCIQPKNLVDSYQKFEKRLLNEEKYAKEQFENAILYKNYSLLNFIRKKIDIKNLMDEELMNKVMSNALLPMPTENVLYFGFETLLQLGYQFTQANQDWLNAAIISQGGVPSNEIISPIASFNTTGLVSDMQLGRLQTLSNILYGYRHAPAALDVPRELAASAGSDNKKAVTSEATSNRGDSKNLGDRGDTKNLEPNAPAGKDFMPMRDLQQQNANQQKDSSKEQPKEDSQSPKPNS